MPLTTGGNTSGSNTKDRASDWPGKSVRASTAAMGTPSTRQVTVLIRLVRKLNQRASKDDSEVISPAKLPQSARKTKAAKGSATNRPPKAAGTKSHLGRPSESWFVAIYWVGDGLPKPAFSKTACPCALNTKSTNSSARSSSSASSRRAIG